MHPSVARTLKCFQTFLLHHLRLPEGKDCVSLAAVSPAPGVVYRFVVDRGSKSAVFVVLKVCSERARQSHYRKGKNVFENAVFSDSEIPGRHLVCTSLPGRASDLWSPQLRVSGGSHPVLLCWTREGRPELRLLTRRGSSLSPPCSGHSSECKLTLGHRQLMRQQL